MGSDPTRPGLRQWSRALTPMRFVPTVTCSDPTRPVSVVGRPGEAVGSGAVRAGGVESHGNKSVGQRIGADQSGGGLGQGRRQLDAAPPTQTGGVDLMHGGDIDTPAIPPPITNTS